MGTAILPGAASTILPGSASALLPGGASTPLPGGAPALLPEGTAAQLQRVQPYALVLGTVQDGGLPQVGCYGERCDRAREDHRLGLGRYVASLALVEPSAERFFLVDATPDIARQLDLISEASFRERARARRPFDGIFVTHAHIGHYLGLGVLGNEGLGISDVPLYCTSSMAAFLEGNEPWAFMTRQGRIVPTPLEPERWHRIDDWLEVQLWQVPHRNELADTVAFLFRGPSATLLYLPDIDSWSAWSSWAGVRRDLVEVAASVDVAMLDATFWSADELPGRALEEIPHPLIVDTMDRLQDIADGGGTRIVFTHLNNSNPALDTDDPEQAEILERGFHVAREGERYPL